MITLRNSKALKFVILLLVVVISFSAIIYFIDARELIESIGVRNSYLLIFFIALIGGVSSFTTGSYLATLYLFVQEGLSIWLLGIAGGIGIFFGDLIFFMLGKHGYKVLSENNNHYVTKFREWLDRRGLRTLQWFSYIYTGWTPLPNDLLTIPLGASGYQFRKFLIPLLVGSIQLQIITGYLFSMGFFTSLAN